MSIRLRLTLLYSAILALTLIVLGVVLYVTVSRVTLNTLQKTLVESAQTIVYSRPQGFEHADNDRRRLAAPEIYFQVRVSSIDRPI